MNSILQKEKKCYMTGSTTGLHKHHDEIWKDVIGYEGLYKISNKGNVRSMTHRKCVHGIDTISNADVMLKPTDNGNGYLIVPLFKDKTRKIHYVHRLVAEHFIDNPEKFQIVNHIDGNKKNNKANNLEWCTQKHNVICASDKMKKPKAKCKNTNTGEKYIRLSNGKYRLCIKCVSVDKTFNSLEEAIVERERIIQEHEEYFAR